MNDNILRILKLIGGKFIFFEDGKPTAVLMDYAEFEKLVEPAVIQKLVNKFAHVEAVNKEITKAQLQDLRDEMMEEVIAKDVVTQEIRVEPIDPV